MHLEAVEACSCWPGLFPFVAGHHVVGVDYGSVQWLLYAAVLSPACGVRLTVLTS